MILTEQMDLYIYLRVYNTLQSEDGTYWMRNQKRYKKGYIYGRFKFYLLTELKTLTESNKCQQEHNSSNNNEGASAAIQNTKTCYSWSLKAMNFDTRGSTYFSSRPFCILSELLEAASVRVEETELIFVPISSIPFWISGVRNIESTRIDFAEERYTDKFLRFSAVASAWFTIYSNVLDVRLWNFPWPTYNTTHPTLIQSMKTEIFSY